MTGHVPDVWIAPPAQTRQSPRRLKEMTAAEVAATLADDARMIVPIGTSERFHPDLPLGAATIIAECLADDLSAEFNVVRAPTVEYGVNVGDLDTSSQKSPAGYPGRVAVRKKTLHRLLNDMLASWENHGVTEFILLTAHPHDPHQEAIDTVATVRARVRVVDLFAVNLSDLIDDSESRDPKMGIWPGSPAPASSALPPSTADIADLYLALMLFLAPTLVRQPSASSGLASQGRVLYDRIRSRISERIFLAPAPSE